MAEEIDFDEEFDDDDVDDELFQIAIAGTAKKKAESAEPVDPDSTKPVATLGTLKSSAEPLGVGSAPPSSNLSQSSATVKGLDSQYQPPSKAPIHELDDGDFEDTMKGIGRLPVPTEFPFPFPPYSIQVKLPIA